MPDGLCTVGSWGAELYPEPVPGSVVVVKDRLDCGQSGAFVAGLERRDVDGLIICGVELVCCVLYAVLGASERATTTSYLPTLCQVKTSATRPTTARSATTYGTTDPITSPTRRVSSRLGPQGLSRITLELGVGRPTRRRPAR